MTRKSKKYVPPVSGVDYNVPIAEAIKRAKDVNEFYTLIAYDTSFQEYRNPIIEEWRTKFVLPIKAKGPFFGGMLDVIRLNDHLCEKLFGYNATQEQKDSMSVYDMCVKVYGVEYAEAWKTYLDNSNHITYLIARYEEIKKEYENNLESPK